jgi:hypothetical protein
MDRGHSTLSSLPSPPSNPPGPGAMSACGIAAKLSPGETEHPSRPALRSYLTIRKLLRLIPERLPALSVARLLRR